MCYRGANQGKSRQHPKPLSPHYCQTNKFCTSPWNTGHGKGPGDLHIIYIANLGSRGGQHQHYFTQIWTHRESWKEHPFPETVSTLKCRLLCSLTAVKQQHNPDGLFITSRLWSKPIVLFFQQKLSFAFRLINL